MRRVRDDSLYCSFCHKPQHSVGRLISSPSDYPRAYICDECVAICHSIIEDDHAESEPRPADGQEALSTIEPHPLLSHPLASHLVAFIEEWVRQESLGADGAEALANMRSTAARMVRDSSTKE
jgi:hypothetical protein